MIYYMAFYAVSIVFQLFYDALYPIKLSIHIMNYLYQNDIFIFYVLIFNKHITEKVWRI